STQDPSMPLGEIARTLSTSAIKVGVTHGALAIPGKHQLNDHPIQVDAATRNGLDYLALGHWHSWQIENENRLVMPGTPEPDGFDHGESRFVALVEIAAPGSSPQIRKLDVAGLSWREFTLEFLDGAEARARLEFSLDELIPQADRTVVRITLKGSADRQT